MPIKTFIAAAAALALALLPAAAPAQQAALTAPSQLSLDLAKIWTDAYETGDAKALAAVYTADAVVAMSGSQSAGRLAIEQAWAEDLAEDSKSLTSLNVTSEVMVSATSHHMEGDYLVIDRETGIVVGQGAFAQNWELQADGKTWQVALEEWQGGKVGPIPIPGGSAPTPSPSV